MGLSTPTIEDELLRQEGLRYVSDGKPGYTRKKRGKGFSYHNTRGDLITDEREIGRIQSLAIPPAWTDVWICPHRNGHIQATGKDARDRKQYRYHDRWREVRDGVKYEQVVRFAEILPAIRKQVATDMKLPGLPREKVLATVVWLLEATLIRVGNAEYAKQNDSYGLTTMRKKHIDVNGSKVRFRFTGKSGKEWNLAVSDRRIANVIRKCSELPGYELFKYEDDQGQIVDVTSADVNAYLKEISGEPCTAKDFRTWAGTVLAAMALDELGKFDTTAQAKRNMVQAIEQVSRQLGNTPAICRKCYIHPAILDSYLEGALAENLEQQVSRKMRDELAHLSMEEILVLAFLRKRLENPAAA